VSKSFADFGKPIPVAFESINLDPNNPRIAPKEGLRYEDPDAIFDEELQQSLTTKVYDVYGAGDLEDAIVAQGWVPIDPIIVWEYPNRTGHYIVVEGNTRISVLRNIRGPRLDREKKKLERLVKGGKVPAEEIKQLERLIKQLETIASDTDKLNVYPVLAKSPEELEEKLPRLLGVRHITHAKQWGPYATNLYITSLYERVFANRYGEDEALRLEHPLIAEVAAMVSLGDTKTRRNIQAASAFGHFRRNYEDLLPEGEKFEDGDQYFFELILQHKYVTEQFGFTKDRLYLPDESEKALFAWAFSKPRANEDKNPNILYKAENLRLWNEMAKYDSENATAFASQFDVSAPEKATKSMRLVEAEYLHHKARQTPLNTLQSLLQALKELKGETMITQSEFLEPTLVEIGDLTKHYLRMMKADAAA
jgi:hypothetical protein